MAELIDYLNSYEFKYPKLSYNELLQRVKSEGGFEKILGGGTASEVNKDTENQQTDPAQSLLGQSIEIEVQQLPVIDFPAMKDLEYEQQVAATPQKVGKILAIKKGNATDSNWTNNFKEGTGQVIINSGRLVFNADKGHMILAGKEGIALGSPGPVNVDSDNSVTLFGQKGLFLGVPNKGEPWSPDDIPAPKDKGDKTKNQAYEPLVLGIKLANLLEDLLVILKNANIVTPIGKAYFLEDTQWEFSCIQSRIPEMLSTFAYIDGVSHLPADPKLPPPEKVTPYPTKLVGTITAVGNSTLNNQTTTQAAPTDPITSPLKDIPGFYDSVDIYTIPET